MRIPDRPVAGIMIADPPDGQPYLGTNKSVVWPKGAITHSIDFALPRGVMMRGKVTEKGSGRPISAAIVAYHPHRTANDRFSRSGSRPVETRADGSFELPVLPRSGYLAVQAPTEDYVLHELDEGLIIFGQPGIQRVYAHAFVACDPKPDGESKEVADVKAELQPGVTVKGQVVGPDGEPVVDIWMLSRIHLNPWPPLLRRWRGDYHGIARNGRFELHGLDPDSEVPVSFFEPKRKLGATVHISGKRAGGAADCRQARAVRHGHGPAGRPGRQAARRIPELRRSISMVVTPGEFSGIKAQERRHHARRPRYPDRHRPDQLRKGPSRRCPGPNRVPGADPGLDVSHHRPDHGPYSKRPSAPQGIHSQARRDARPGRYPDRKAIAVGSTELSFARRKLPPARSKQNSPRSSSGHVGVRSSSLSNTTWDTIGRTGAVPGVRMRQ